jgi:hypothetical protein
MSGIEIWNALMLLKFFHFDKKAKAKYFSPIGLYHSLYGVNNLKYKLLYFLTPDKKNSKRKALAFSGLDAAI